MANSNAPSEISERSWSLLKGILKARRIDELKKLDPELSEEQRKAAIELIDKNNEYIEKLFDFDGMDALFEEFVKQSNVLNPKLYRFDIEKIFLAFAKEMFVTKIKIIDSMKIKDVAKQLGHFDSQRYGILRLIWSEALDKESAALRIKLQQIFKPLKSNKEPHNTFLFAGPAGKARAKKRREEDSPNFAFMSENPFENLEYTEDVFMPDLDCDDKCNNWELDESLYIILWNALSAEYSINNKGEVSVFLAEGEIAPTSVLWNTELNELRKMEQSGKIKLKINYFMLTPEADLKSKEMSKEIKDLKDQRSELQEKKQAIRKRIKDEGIQEPELSSLNAEIADIKSKQLDLDTKIDDLKDKRKDLTEADDSWRKVNFEDLHIKGHAIAPGKPLTIGNLQKISKHMLTNLEQKKQNKKGKIEPADKPSKIKPPSKKT